MKTALKYQVPVLEPWTMADQWAYLRAWFHRIVVRNLEAFDAADDLLPGGVG